MAGSPFGSLHNTAISGGTSGQRKAPVSFHLDRDAEHALSLRHLGRRFKADFTHRTRVFYRSAPGNERVQPRNDGHTLPEPRPAPC